MLSEWVQKLRSIIQSVFIIYIQIIQCRRGVRSKICCTCVFEIDGICPSMSGVRSYFSGFSFSFVWCERAYWSIGSV